jgi:hypothetical protein
MLKRRFSYFSSTTISHFSQEEYEEMIQALNPEDGEPQIPNELLETYAHRTNKILLQREYLLEHSSASNLVIM